MPETRYVETYQDGVLIDKEPYEVSDEQLQDEADTARLKEICAMAHSAIPLPSLVEAVAIICKKLGYI